MKTNEIARWFIHLRPLIEANRHLAGGNVSIDSSISIVREESEPMGESLNCISAFSWTYSNIREICRTRATRAESGELLVKGKKLKAEDYIREWRKAEALKMSYTELLEQGLHIAVTIAKPTQWLNNSKTEETYPWVREARFSSWVIHANDVQTIWRIPLLDHTGIQTFAQISGTYTSSNDYPMPSHDNVYTVGTHEKVSLPGPKLRASHAAPMNQEDLFGAMA